MTYKDIMPEINTMCEKNPKCYVDKTQGRDNGCPYFDLCFEDYEDSPFRTHTSSCWQRARKPPWRDSEPNTRTGTRASSTALFGIRRNAGLERTVPKPTRNRQRLSHKGGERMSNRNYPIIIGHLGEGRSDKCIVAVKNDSGVTVLICRLKDGAERHSGEVVAAWELQSVIAEMRFCRKESLRAFIGALQRISDEWGEAGQDGHEPG